MSSSTPQTSGAKALPKDAQLMASILKDMGITEYEPKVINQMLEFTYRYITDVLEDAKAYSSHANKKNVDTEDVALAVHTKMDNAFTTPPPRELLLELARAKNAQPLPLIKQGAGLRLPPDRFCFLAPNYRVRSSLGGSSSSGGQTSASSSGGQPSGFGRGAGSSLQANAIQAALGGGRRGGSTQRVGVATYAAVKTNPGTVTTVPSMNLVTKGVSKPTVTLVASKPAPPLHGVPGVLGSSTGPRSLVLSSSVRPSPGLTFAAPQQQAPLIMVRPGMPPGAVVNVGLKRKHDDDMT